MRSRTATPPIVNLSLLHHLRLLARALPGRALLLWFVLSLGAAAASPLVNPQALELVCTSAGVMKLVVRGDGGDAQPLKVGAHADCPLCAPVAPPPVPAPGTAPQAAPAGLRIALAGADGPPPARASAPLPARGPPHLCTAFA